jgi:hypothetical protein
MLVFHGFEFPSPVSMESFFPSLHFESPIREDIEQKCSGC